jgi:hypothetical protein
MIRLLLAKKRSAKKEPIGIPGKTGVKKASPINPNLFLMRIIRLFVLVKTFWLGNRFFFALKLLHHLIKAALK